MGVIDQPVIPLTWREEPANATKRKVVVLELDGRTDGLGNPAIFKGADSAECLRKAKAAGWDI